MKRTQVKVPWDEGLHMRPAAQIVECAKKYQSNTRIRLGSRIADSRSILSIIMLCATFGTVLEVESYGNDEDAAIAEISSIFSGDEIPDSCDGLIDTREDEV